MSFLARLSARALPALSRAPVVMPKGMAARQMAPLYREAAPPEEDPGIAPLRAAAARPLRRQEAPSDEDEEMARAPAAETQESEEEKPVQPARVRREPQAEEEEAVAPLRRAEGEEEEAPEVAPLRRAEATDEPEDEPIVQPMRLIRRAEEVPLDDGEKPLRQPFQDNLMPGAMPAHPDLAGEEEPSPLQALRRDAATPPQPAVSAPPEPRARSGADGWFPRPVSDWGAGAETGFAEDENAAEAGSFGPAQTPGRAEVVIDQLDVLIHEPSPTSMPSRVQPDHSRLLRARYLRRL